jgi:hypothetical protein
MRPVAIATLLLLVPSCSDTPGGRPDGWTKQTHGKDADPNYSVVFEQGVVKRLDVTIAPDSWQAMLEDMTAKYGKFGEHDGGGEEEIPLPPGMADACKDKAAGDACTVVLGTSLSGSCASQTTACIPSGWPEACAGKKGGEACTVSLGGPPAPGSCVTAGATRFCLPDPPSGEGPPVGEGEFKKDNPDPIYVPCTLSFEGRSWWYVGIRFKGYSSLRRTWQSGSYKLPLRIDTDEFEDEHPEVKNQRFHGFKELSLSNNSFDPSLLREKVVPDLFRQAGVPAPRTAFYRVHIDHGQGPVYFGLYTMIEVPDEPMFGAQFIKKSGNLYKPEGIGATWSKFDEASFPKKTNEDENDYSDIKAAIAALQASQTDRPGWRSDLEQVFDAPGFVRWLAVNTVLVNWDTYGNSPQNYYLYGDPGRGGRLHWIPWDNNMALSSTGGKAEPLPLDMSSVKREQWPLIGKLIDDPLYHATYVREVARLIETEFSVASAQARIRAAHDLIRPHVVGSSGEQAGYTDLRSDREFEHALTDLLEHVARRNDAARRFVNASSSPATDAGAPDDGGTTDSD